MPYVARLSLAVRALVIVLLAPGLLFAARAPIGPGDRFPSVSFPVPDRAADRRYLGIESGTGFVLDRLKADLVLVELLNVYCYTCRQQADLNNEVYRLIESNPKTRGRIKLISVAAGSDLSEVAEYRKEFQIPYPVLPDPEFRVFHALGGEVSPYTFFVRLIPREKPLVVRVHLGLSEPPPALFQSVRKLASLDLKRIRAGIQPAPPAPVKIKPVLSPEELKAKATEILSRAAGREVRVRKLKLESAQSVFTTVGEKGLRLFAELVERNVPCDVCHPVHFLYVFDSTGRILSFEPVRLSRYGNRPFNEKDTAKMRERLVGKTIRGRIHFDPKVDAVSEATITSAVIFDSLSNRESLLEELKRKGWIRTPEPGNTGG